MRYELSSFRTRATPSVAARTPEHEISAMEQRREPTRAGRQHKKRAPPIVRVGGSGRFRKQERARRRRARWTTKKKKGD